MYELASFDNSLSHSLKTPAAVLEIARSIQDGKALPDGVTADAFTYKPRESLLRRFLSWIGLGKSCGCKSREAWMNSWVPYSGTLLRWFTTLTGVKWLVDKWYQELAKQSPTGFRTARSATPSTKSDTSHYPDNQP